MKKLRIILALACSFTTSTHAVVQAKAAPRAGGTVFRDCRPCPEMFPVWLLRPATRERNPADYRNDIMGFRVARTLP